MAMDKSIMKNLWKWWCQSNAVHLVQTCRYSSDPIVLLPLEKCWLYCEANLFSKFLSGFVCYLLSSFLFCNFLSFGFCSPICALVPRVFIHVPCRWTTKSRLYFIVLWYACARWTPNAVFGESRMSMNYYVHVEQNGTIRKCFFER
jgi:hypothetical protein